ncbi:MAG: hypothetical protein ACYDD1_02335 [Caulobacteraceae bacterium]
MAEIFTTPVGRLVQGDCYTAQARKDSLGKDVLKDGKPVMQFFVAVAIPKNDPATPTFLESLRVQDRAAWPQYHNAQGQCTNPTFADKITDGDGTDEKGVPHSRKEGFAGHWVIKSVSGFAPKVVKHTPSGWVDTMPGEIKVGDYVRISGRTSSNMSQQSPGMYRNLDMIAFDHEGAAIVNGPSAEDRFGPPGGGSPMAAAATTGQPAPAATPASPMAAPAPGPAAAPYAGYMAPPPAPNAPTPPPAAKATKPGSPYTYEALVVAGWTDEQMTAQGYL